MKIHFVSTSLLRSLHCNNIAITKFSFPYQYYVHYAMIKTKRLYFLLMLKLISPLRLLCQDLEKLHIFISLILPRILESLSNLFNILATTTAATTFTTVWFWQKILFYDHDQENSLFYFFGTFTTSWTKE